MFKKTLKKAEFSTPFPTIDRHYSAKNLYITNRELKSHKYWKCVTGWRWQGASIKDAAPTDTSGKYLNICKPQVHDEFQCANVLYLTVHEYTWDFTCSPQYARILVLVCGESLLLIGSIFYGGSFSLAYPESCCGLIALVLGSLM